MSDQIEQVQALENFHGLEAGSLAKIVSGEAVEVNLDNYRPAADFDTYKNNIDTDFESKKEELKDIYRKEGIERKSSFFGSTIWYLQWKCKKRCFNY